MTAWVGPLERMVRWCLRPWLALFNLFFVGYADSETPGGRIRAAQPGDKVLLDPAYPAVPLNCEVRIFDFSGHSTRDAIADYAVRVKPKKIFLVHGDDGAMA